MTRNLPAIVSYLLTNSVVITGVAVSALILWIAVAHIELYRQEDTPLFQSTSHTINWYRGLLKSEQNIEETYTESLEALLEYIKPLKTYSGQEKPQEFLTSLLQQRLQEIGQIENIVVSLTSLSKGKAETTSFIDGTVSFTCFSEQALLKALHYLDTEAFGLRIHSFDISPQKNKQSLNSIVRFRSIIISAIEG